MQFFRSLLPKLHAKDLEVKPAGAKHTLPGARNSAPKYRRELQSATPNRQAATHPESVNLPLKSLGLSHQPERFFPTSSVKTTYTSGTLSTKPEPQSEPAGGRAMARLQYKASGFRV